MKIALMATITAALAVVFMLLPRNSASTDIVVMTYAQSDFLKLVNTEPAYSGLTVRRLGRTEWFRISLSSVSAEDARRKLSGMITRLREWANMRTRIEYTRHGPTVADYESAIVIVEGARYKPPWRRRLEELVGKLQRSLP